MLIENQNIKKVKFSLVARIAILVASLCTMASDMVIIPIINLLYSVFPESSASMITLAYAAGGLAFIPTSLLTPALCRRYSLRRIMLTGTLLCIVGGGLGGVVNKLTYLIIMHFIEGAGAGLCTNLIPIYFAALCRDEEDIIRMNSMNGVFGTILGFIVTLLSGIIAARFGWQSAYYLYFLEIIVLILQIIFLPDLKSESGQSKKAKATYKRHALRWFVEVYLIAAFTCLMWTHLSGFIAEKALGGSDVAGIVSSAGVIGGLVGSAAMVWVMRKAKSFFQNISLGLYIVSLLIMLTAQTTVQVCIAGLIWGFGQGLFFPFLWAKATVLSYDQASISGTIALTTISWYLADGTANIIYSPIAEIFNNHTNIFAMYVTTIAIAILFLYRLFIGIFERKRT